MCHSCPSPWNSSILSVQCFNFRVLILLFYSPPFFLSFSPRCLFSFSFLFCFLFFFHYFFFFAFSSRSVCMYLWISPRTSMCVCMCARLQALTRLSMNVQVFMVLPVGVCQSTRCNNTCIFTRDASCRPAHQTQQQDKCSVLTALKKLRGNRKAALHRVPLNTAAVTGCTGGYRLSMRYSYRARRHQGRI